MFKTYNRLYDLPDENRLRHIKVPDEKLSPRIFYDSSKDTLLIKYTYIRLIRIGDCKYKVDYHYRHTKRSLSVVKPSEELLRKLGQFAIKEEYSDIGLMGETYDYYTYNTNTADIPEPWYHKSTQKDANETAQYLFDSLDLGIEQTIYIKMPQIVRPEGYANHLEYFDPIFKASLGNGKTLEEYGTWQYSAGPIDKLQLFSISFTPNGS